MPCVKVQNSLSENVLSEQICPNGNSLITDFFSIVLEGDVCG